MALPSYEDLMQPLLEIMQNENELHVRDARIKVAERLALENADVERMYEKSGGNIYADRLSWAALYLKNAGMISSPKRAVIKITPLGLETISNGIKVNNTYLKSLSSSHKIPSPSQDERNIQKTPEEVIETQAKILTKALSDELIEKIIALSPAFFERLTVDLLLAMGYGGSHKKAAARLGKTGDGGVDGVINEDMLGLDVVYIQAKRYQPNNKVPVGAVRDFAGSLEAYKANKGVFITTSDFTADSYDFVDKISKRIILINGTELASLLIDKGVGVRLESRYDIMKIDEGYFEE